jgi:hypothetical protein
MLTILEVQEVNYNSLVLTIIAILIIGRMIDRFVNGNNNN